MLRKCKVLIFYSLILMIFGCSGAGLWYVLRLGQEDKIILLTKEWMTDISQNHWDAAYAISKYGSVRLKDFCNQRKMVCDMYVESQLIGLGEVQNMKVLSHSFSKKYAHVMFALDDYPGRLLVLLVKEKGAWKLDLLLLRPVMDASSNEAGGVLPQRERGSMITSPHGV